MARHNTKADKPRRGEQEPFARKHAQVTLEMLRLRDECAARIEKMWREARAEVLRSSLMCRDACDSLRSHEALHRDFAAVVPVLRSKSILRRL
jgi:hypothetical protein